MCVDYPYTMKREMTSVDVAAVVMELQEYLGARFDKFYQYPDGRLRVKMRHHEHGRLELMLEAGDVKRIHLTTEPEDAPERPPDLPMLMRKRLEGGELTAVEQHDFDRVVSIEGERDDEYTLVAELFGDGNAAFLDDDGVVLRCLRTVRLKSRTVAGGEPYRYPPSRVDPLSLDFEGFVEVMEDSDTDFVRTLASQLNFGGLYAEEVCLRAGVEKEKQIQNASREDYRALYEGMQEVFQPLTDGDLEPHVVYRSGEPVDVLPFELRKYGDDDREYYDSFNEALDEYYELLDEVEEEDEEGGVEHEIQKHRNIIRQQEEAIKEFEEKDRSLREMAEELYLHYGLVDELLDVVSEARSEGYSWDEIRGKLEEGREQGFRAAEAVSRVGEGRVYVEIEGMEVPLDPGMGVEKNANRLYEEAKEVEEKREGAIEAMEERREELERLRRKEDQAGGDEGDGDASSTLKPRGDQWYTRFRWFRTSDGYLVIGGRDADQNEEIYRKYMEPRDLFFHTQAEGAPITVMKATEPDEPAREVDFPESSREEAAQFAASYSSVWAAGQYSADVYSASPDQVSKTPESGEYIEKGSVVVRGERTYYTAPLRLAVGLRLDSEAGVVGGPPSAIKGQADYYVELEPGRYSRNDAAKKVYRRFLDHYGDESLVRQLAGVDEVRRYLPGGGSRLID